TYPYVAGGVSSWTHDLLLAQKDLTFHLVTLVPRDSRAASVYQLPVNVVGHTVVHIQALPDGARSIPHPARLAQEISKCLLQLLSGGGLDHLRALLSAIKPHRQVL